MASLRITNLTEAPLSFTSSSLSQDLRSRWTRVEPGDKIELPVALSSKLLRKWTKLGLQVFLTPSFTGEKSQALVEPCTASPWSLSICRPRFGSDASSWYIVRPACQHVRGYRTRSSRSRARACSTCSEQFPWSVYVLHTRTESHVLFLRTRDMSSFLSEIGDETPLSDLVLPGTHDSLAFYGWPVSQCQSPTQPLSSQLASGIRALDIRLSVIDGVLMAYHGTAPQRTSFSAVLHTLYHFLQEQPRECVVVSVKQEDFATTPWRVFSRCVREELERGSGGMGMWWLENRIPELGEVRGRCIMLSRFGGAGQGWENGLEGMGIHPTEWPDSQREGFEWDLKGTTVRTHDWYSIPSLLSLPEKAALCIQNLVPSSSDPPTLGITFLSAAGGALALPPFCALGLGWPSWGLGVEGVNSRVGKWLLGRLTSTSAPQINKEKARESMASDCSDVGLLDKHDSYEARDEKIRPVRGWVFIDYFAEPDGGLVPLLVENNFLGR